MAIHRKLKRAREQANLTLEEAADYIGIRGASLSRMENGLSKVTIDRLAELSALYGVSASDLVDGSIISTPSSIDIDRLKQVVEMVQRVVIEQSARPSPEKMALAVSEIYRLEVGHLKGEPTAEFDPDRHTSLIHAIFQE